MVGLVVGVIDALAVGVFRPILPYGQVPGIPGVPYLSRRQNGFEYDEKKGNTNSKKHGIDFIEAQKLWKNPDLLEIPAGTQDEERFLLIGKIEEKHWSGVILALVGLLRVHQQPPLLLRVLLPFPWCRGRCQPQNREALSL